MKDEEELLDEARRSREETEALRKRSEQEHDRSVEPWAPEPDAGADEADDAAQ